MKNQEETYQGGDAPCSNKKDDPCLNQANASESGERNKKFL
jgi:hypothetical protein